ncbi:hypothetical protein BJ912DRAFT_981294, partial [Pholiota molesta]
MRPKWPNLAKLPRAKRWTSINDRFQNPASVEAFFPGYNSKLDPNRIGNYGEMFDPTHPSARMRVSHFPKVSVKQDVFEARIFPVARLVHGMNPYPEVPIMTWSERVQMAHDAGFSAVRIKGRTVLCKGKDEQGRPLPYDGTEQVYPEDDIRTFGLPTRNATPKGPFLALALGKLARRVPMTFSNATSKKRMGSYAYMRAKIAKRLRGALHLIVTRGAHVVEHTEPLTGALRTEICLNEDEAGKKWSMQGWTYIFYPTTELYRMPLSDLISLVSNSLKTLNDAARKMENTWLAESLLYYRERPPESRSTQAKEKTSAIDVHPTVQHTDVDVAPASAKELLTSPTLVSKIKLPRRRSVSVAATGAKNPKIWKKELETGLALLAERLPKRLPKRS